jgi:hypothetical protein
MLGTEHERVVLGHWEGELIGYAPIGDQVVYLTDEALGVVGREAKKQETPIEGHSIVNFTAHQNGQVALLFRSNKI